MSAVAVAAVVTAGVGIAGAAGAFGPGTPAAPNYGQTLKQTINDQISTLPQQLTAQQNYALPFAAVNSLTAYQNLFGAPGTTGTSSTIMPAGWYDSAGNLVSTNQSEFAAPATTPGNSNGFANGRSGEGINKNAGPAGTGANNPNGYVWRSQFTKTGTSSTPATPGTLAMAAQAQPQLLALQSQGRAQDIADVQTLGPAAYAAIGAYDPSATNLLNTANAQVQARLNGNGALDPFTQMALQQNYRSGEAARGLAGGTSDAAMEAYYQAATQEQRQVQNIGLANTQVQQDQSYYGDPFMQVLGRTSGGVQVPGQTYSATNGSVTQAAGAAASPEAFNLAGMGYQAQVGAQNAGYLSQQAGIKSTLGALTPGNLSAISNLGNYFGSDGSTAPTGMIPGLGY